MSARRHIPHTLALSVLAGCSAAPSGPDGGQRDAGQRDSGTMTSDAGQDPPLNCGRDAGGLTCQPPCEIDYGYRTDYLSDGGLRNFCESEDAGYTLMCQCFV